MTLSARTLIPASSHSGCPTEPTATHLPTGISFASFPQCKMANSGGSCIPLSTTAKRKEPMTQNPNCLSLGSNPGSPTSRLHRHTHVTTLLSLGLPICKVGMTYPALRRAALTGLRNPAEHPLLPRTHPQGLLQTSTCYMPSPVHGRQPLPRAPDKSQSLKSTHEAQAQLRGRHIHSPIQPAR